MKPEIPLIIIHLALVSCVPNKTSESDTAAYDPCATFFYIGLGHKKIERWQIAYIRGEWPPEWGISAPPSRLLDKLSERAAKCLYDPNRGILAAEYGSANIGRKLTLLTSFAAELSAGHSNADFQGRLAAGHQGLYEVAINPAQGAFKLALKAVGSICRDIDTLAKAAASNLKIIDQVQDIATVNLVIAEICDEKQTARLAELEAQCASNANGSCALLDAYAALQFCKAENRTTADLKTAIQDYTSKLAESQKNCSAHLKSMSDSWATLTSGSHYVENK